MAADEKVEEILQKYNVFESAEHKKLRCRVTGHELPRRLDDLEQYVKTPKFQRAFKIDVIMKSHGQYFEDVGDPNLIGCKVTKTVIARDPDDLERHVNGKKFKRMLARGWMEGESDDEEMEQEDSEEDEEENEEEEEEEEEVVEEKFMKMRRQKEKKADDFDFDSMDIAETIEEPQKEKSVKRKHPGSGVAKLKKRTRK